MRYFISDTTRFDYNTEEVDMLTFQEFGAINSRLKASNDTWSDLWAFLYYLEESVGRVVILKYSDISGGYIALARKGRLREKHLLIPRPVDEILKRRKKAFPNDIFIFQSHSNRIGNEIKPVTIIAFNMALKRAAKGVTDKKISSKDASYCTIFRDMRG